MPLKGHVSPDTFEKKQEGKALINHERPSLHEVSYGTRFENKEAIKKGIPKYVIPENSMTPKLAYRLIKDELLMDSQPLMNCATFITSWMDDEAEKLIQENIAKNFVDQDGFPSSQVVHERCVSMLAHLWKVPKGLQAIGTVCGGSSEALMLGCLAMKWKWRESRKSKNMDHSKPNMVFSSIVHCCIEKFTRYFDVEPRIIPVTKESNYVLDIKNALSQVDENTIGIVAVLGSTYTGHFENVQHLSYELDKLCEEKGYDIPIHVDAASGGFIAPFIYDRLSWSFEVKRVVSINASGHKYGMVYPGIGWVLWKSKEHLHKDLVFELNYLGTTEHSFTLNFSRPTSHIFAQYYNFLRLGMKGYTSIMNSCIINARLLSISLEKSGYFDVLSDIHRKIGSSLAINRDNVSDVKEDVFVDNYRHNLGLPLVAFTFSKKVREQRPDLNPSDLAHLLRTTKWLVPSYNLPLDCKDTKILRVVVKECNSRDMLDNLLRDLISCTEALINSKSGAGDVFENLLKYTSIDATSAQDEPRSIQASSSETFTHPC